MIGRLFNHPYVLWQTGTEDEIPNEALACCIDNGGTILVRQGAQEIVIGKATVPEFCKLLKQLAAPPDS